MHTLNLQLNEAHSVTVSVQLTAFGNWGMPKSTPQLAWGTDSTCPIALGTWELRALSRRTGWWFK